MEFSQEIKDSIKNNMLHITTQMKNKPRNYLNKQLQDAVCNYFLENYAAPFLKQEYQIVSGRELRKNIEKSLPKQGKKYINLLNKFKSEIQRVNKGDEYRQMLSSIICEEEKYNFETEEWCTLQRKKILALLLIVHWDEENILNFYDMWNSLFPTDPLVKQKLSKEEKEKKKRQSKNTNIEAVVFTQLSYSNSSEFYSQENISINSKRSSSSYIPQQSSESQISQQVRSYYVQQEQTQPIQKKVINNRIFEDEEEQEDQFLVKTEYIPSTKVRICENINYQQQQPISSGVCNSYNYVAAQPTYEQQYTYQVKQEQQQDFISADSLENCYSSESSSDCNENILGFSQICNEDSCSSKNEVFSQYNPEEFYMQQDIFNNNSLFVPNYPVFMNENANLLENTLFSFLNF